MGGNSSTRRVSFEADENDNITVVKGIRLSDSVIGRMREPSPFAGKAQPIPSPPPPPPTPSPQQPASGDLGTPTGRAVNEEDLRKRISEELALEQARRESEKYRRIDQDKSFVREEIGRVLEREKLAANEHLSRAIFREKASTEEERLKAKHFAQLLEEKEKQLKKQDEYYKEQVARLEERSAQFYKLTTEQYLKASTEIESKFKRYEASPLCAGLQDQILQCYQQNPKQTLNCSSLASQYLHCVNSAKQTMLRRGG